MASQRKVFHIEMSHLGEAVEPVSDGVRYRELLSEIKALRALVIPTKETSVHLLETFRDEIAQAQKLKGELDLIHGAIDQTKREIATLHVTGFEGPEMARVNDELDAIVSGTEHATDRILEAAEFIDDAATKLGDLIGNQPHRALAQDIQDRVTQLFEACNFQDLTGQRIAKVVETLRFIETHIVRMIEIWGGMETFADIEPEIIPVIHSEHRLTAGPKLDGELGHASQDDIDALFK
jgi:chemotaxis protein CheZ